MSPDSALAALQPLLRQAGALLRQGSASWHPFALGLACGLLIGALLSLLRPRQQRRPQGPPGFGSMLLALAPAVVACLLWGVWLGILAAKSRTP